MKKMVFRWNVLLWCLPALFFFFQVQQGFSEGNLFPFSSQKQVLQAIPKKPKVLINVSEALFPATWDITLLGRGATKALQNGLLGNTKSNIRWKCAQILTQLRDASVRPTLHKALGDWSSKVRNQALLALAEIGDKESVPFILKRFQEEDQLQNKVQALRTLGKLGDTRASDLLESLYQKEDTNKLLRRESIEAFWALREVLPKEKITTLMRKALTDKDPLIARLAIIALGELKDAESISEIAKHLKSSSTMLRNIAAYALGQVGDSKGIPVLVEALSSVRSGRFLNNIAFALQKLNDPRLNARLKEFLQNQQAFIRLNVAFTVGEMKLQSARELVEGLLEDPNLVVRNQAIIALAKMQDAKAIPALLRAVKKNSGDPKWFATLAVMFLSEGKQFREILFQQVMYSKASYQKQKAAMLLAHFGDQRAVPYLYYLLKFSYGEDYWNSAKKLNDPILNDLMFKRFQSRLRAHNTSQLVQLMTFLGKEKLRAFQKELVGLLFHKWFHPYAQRKGRYNRYLKRYVYPKVTSPNTYYYVKKNDRKDEIHFWGKSGQDSVLQHLIEFLGSSHDAGLKHWLQYFAFHQSYHIRTAALVALSQCGDKKALKALMMEFNQSSDRHRPFLVLKLSKLPLSVLQKELQKHLENSDPFFRFAAAGTLLLAGQKSASKVLLEGLRLPQETLRNRAKYFLELGHKKKTVPSFQNLIQKEKNTAAKNILEEIQSNVRQEVNPAFDMFKVRKVRLDK